MELLWRIRGCVIDSGCWSFVDVDVCRKYSMNGTVTRVGCEVENEMCRVGIGWHGVADLLSCC